MKTDELADEILVQGLQDYLELAAIISIAHFEVGIPFGPQMIARVSQSIESLVDQGFAIVGNIGKRTSDPLITPWPGNAEEIRDRLVSEWKALGRRPNLGDVCWLSLTQLGRKRGYELQSQR